MVWGGCAGGCADGSAVGGWLGELVGWWLLRSWWWRWGCGWAVGAGARACKCVCAWWRRLRWWCWCWWCGGVVAVVWWRLCGGGGGSVGSGAGVRGGQVGLGCAGRKGGACIHVCVCVCVCVCARARLCVCARVRVRSVRGEVSRGVARSGALRIEGLKLQALCQESGRFPWPDVGRDFLLRWWPRHTRTQKSGARDCTNFRCQNWGTISCPDSGYQKGDQVWWPGSGHDFLTIFWARGRAMAMPRNWAGFPDQVLATKR